MVQFALYGLILGVLLIDCESRCPSSSWSLYNGYCYQVVYGYPESAKSWYDAEDYCREKNGTLVSIHSSEEVDNVLEQLKTWSVTDYVWIGLNSLAKPRNFTWSDGSPNNYEIWEAPRTSNKCIMMDKKTGEWKDQNCGYLQGFVCKRKEGTIVPTPPSVPKYYPSGNCPSGWYKYGFKCYKYFENVGVNWKEAKRQCESLGENHYLVSIHSTEEQMFITSLLGNHNNDAWIGLERSYTSRLEMWSDNSRYDYSYWMPGDGSFYWITQCPKMRGASKTAGKWEGVMCNEKADYICQREPDTAIKTSSEDPSTCKKEGYVNYRDACYRLVKERKTWQQAQQLCKEEDGNLVTITNAFENAFLYHTLEGISENVWIGFSDKEGNGRYQWIDGWPNVFLKWQGDEPKPSNSPKCVYANNNTREWGTESCEYQYAFICKITKEVPPVFPIKQNQGKCPFPSNSSLDFGGEYCYHLGDRTTKTWASAMLYCMQKGATLASFHSEYETELLWPLIGTDAALMWIGLYQREDGEFVWQNGDRVDFTNWATGIRQEGGCVYIDSKDMFWVRQTCADAYKPAAPLCMANKQ